MSYKEQDLPFEPRKLARGGDPGTSKAAALQAGELRGQHHRKIMAALHIYKDSTPYRIAEFAKLEVAAVFRRLNELEKAGKIYTTGKCIGPTGRACRIWKAL